ILFKLIGRGLFSSTARRPFLFLLIVLIGSMIADSAWIFSLMRSLWFPHLYYQAYIFWVRIAWGFYVIQYQALALFMESLVDQSATLNIRQKIFSFISIFFLIFAVYLAFFRFNCLSAADRPAIEFVVRNMQTYYMLLILMLLS